MAVYCGVCAVRLTEAAENFGSFRATGDLDAVEPGRIRDTCERCSKVLAAAVTKAANAIARKHRPAIEKLRAEQTKWREREEAHAKKEAEFRQAWEAERLRREADERFGR